MTDTSDAAPAASTPAERDPARRLEDGVHRLRVPEPNTDAEALLTKLGVALPIVGLVIIAVAGYRAGGTVYVADQIPMLITGGVLGLGLIIVGAALFIRFSMARYLRFWLARLVAEAQTADRGPDV